MRNESKGCEWCGQQQDDEEPRQLRWWQTIRFWILTIRAARRDSAENVSRANWAKLVRRDAHKHLRSQALALFSVKVQVRPRQLWHVARAPVSLHDTKRFMTQSQKMSYLVGERVGQQQFGRQSSSSRDHLHQVIIDPSRNTRTEAIDRRAA